MVLRFLLPAVLLLFSSVALAQVKQFADTALMQNRLPKDIYQPIPSVVNWISDDEVVLAQRPHPDSAYQAFTLQVRTGKTSYLPIEKAIQLQESSRSVFSKNNDLYIRSGSQERRLTNNPAPEENPTFSPDSNFIAYTRGNNLFSYNLATSTEVQLTTDGTSTILNGYASWLYWEEIFGRQTRFRAFWWSPDSRTIAYMRFDESMVPMFPIYVHDGQYGSLEETRYPKAGDKNPEVKIGMVPATGGTTVWADFNEKDDQYFGWPVWNPAANELWVSWMNRRQDRLIVYAVNRQTGNKQQVYLEEQDTWIKLEDDAGSRITFLPANKGFILQSDKSGYNHLYLHNMDGSLKNAITAGKFTVKEIMHIDPKNGVVYFTARGLENTARTDVYRVRLDGKNLKRLTTGNYHHLQISFSPSAKYFISTYSNTSTPQQVALVNSEGKLLHHLGNAKGVAFDDYARARTELIRIKSTDGLYDLPAVVTWPVNYDRNKKYPLLINIYGGPDAGTVNDQWIWNADRQWFAQEGLIQVAFDHRASGHFGKEGQNFIHRKLGYWELEDYETMTKWFIENAGADSTRICIAGFSYGGYLSALALTNKPHIFTHGMAGGSVTDWRLYDTHYTERFMQTPQDNPEGYEKSSVLNYVDQYKGMLQIVHGTTDDNVHVQNSLQLVSALQDRKKDFEMMFYPGGRHGWPRIPGKWSHYTNLKNNFIYQHLLQKPMPAALRR